MVRLVKPMIVKEFRQIRRDPTSLGMLLVLPSALIVLVGYALDFNVRHVPLVVLDHDRTSQSRSFLDIFKYTPYFEYRGDVSGAADLERCIMNNEARAAIVVPAGFGSEILSGGRAQAQIIVDGSDANSAGQAVANAARMTVEYSNRIVLASLRRAGGEQVLPVDFRPRIWYNPDLETSKFMIPGLIGFIMVLTGVVSTSLTVVREKERGTMEQLMVSPLKPIHVVVGKTLPYLAISLIAATAILIIGILLFGVDIRGSVALLYLGILAITVGALGQGLLISTVTNSQQVAFMISVFSSLLPSFLLSGFVFPVANMPVFLQVLSNLAVNKFFLVVVRGVMLRGAGMDVLWPQFLYMGAFALVMLGISIRRMQKRTL